MILIIISVCYASFIRHEAINGSYFPVNNQHVLVCRHSEDLVYAEESFQPVYPTMLKTYQHGQNRYLFVRLGIFLYKPVQLVSNA